MSSETKALRTMREINQEYGQSCMRAGEIQYKIDVLTSDLKVLNKTLRDLNFEAVAVTEAEAKAKAATEQAKSEAANNVTPITQEQSNG